MRFTEDLKNVIAENIAALRRNAGMTQLDLAERLNYTDKAISKWERGESIPDVAVLKNIADMFGVTVDYLLESDHKQEKDGDMTADGYLQTDAQKVRNAHGAIIGMSVLLVWLLATGAFVLLELLIGAKSVIFLPFVCAVPCSFIVWLVLNSVWYGGKHNYLIISALMWTVIAAVHVSLILFGLGHPELALIYLLGVPGQAIIIMWYIWSARKGNS